MPLRLAVAFILCASSFARAQTDSSRSSPIAPLVRVPANTWGAGVMIIDSAEIAASTAVTFSELLQARRPGLRVLRSGGLASDGALVMLRGPTSLIGSSAPIIIVDGVRVDPRQYDQPLVIGSSAPSRLDDLTPEDIERIEILSGAAAALFGDGAANGVILITTKSGGQGPLRLTGRVSYSATQNNADYPANFQRVGTSPTTGQPVTDCSLGAVAAGTCAPTGLRVWNPLEQASPFRTGNTAFAHAALGGTAFGTSLFAGATGTGRQGVLPHDAIDRFGGRAKVVREFPGHFSLEASGGAVREHARSAVDGNIAVEANVIGNGLAGYAEDGPTRGYYPNPGSTDSVFPARRLHHTTGGVTLGWHPGTWLHASAIAGRDLVSERWHADHIGIPMQPVYDDRLVERHDMRTLGGNVTSSYPLGAGVAASTTAGIQRDVLQTATYDSIGAPPVFSYSESSLRVRSTAFRLTEGVHAPRQIHANISAERVTSTFFGSSGGKEWFPSANVSWSPFVDTHGVSDLRLRAAYAEAPGSSTTLLSVGGISAPFSQAPPPPKTERTRSAEFGGEATIGRLTRVDFTAFSDRSTRLWISGVPSPSGPSTTQLGTMTNNGIETMIGTTLLNVSMVRWDGTLSLGFFHNRVTGLPTPPPVGTVRNPASNGYSFGGVWAQSYTYADVNHDGIIAGSEVQLGPVQYAGPALPTLESVLTSELSLPGHIVFSALLDYRHGNHAFDVTSRYRCEALVCRETQDPTAPLDRQAASVASALSNYSATGYVSDASFMKVREIAVRWTIPPAGSRYLGVNADLTIAARNLATWTNYRGLDPEISYQSPDVLPRQEFLTMPLPRQLVVRLDVRP